MGPWSACGPVGGKRGVRRRRECQAVETRRVRPTPVLIVFLQEGVSTDEAIFNPTEKARWLGLTTLAATVLVCVSPLAFGPAASSLQQPRERRSAPC